jgi:transcription termination factor Rho
MEGSVTTSSPLGSLQVLDKETLTLYAKSLGLRVTSRMRKNEIIAIIEEATKGSGSAEKNGAHAKGVKSTDLRSKAGRDDKLDASGSVAPEVVAPEVAKSNGKRIPGTIDNSNGSLPKEKKTTAVGTEAIDRKGAGDPSLFDSDQPGPIPAQDQSVASLSVEAVAQDLAKLVPPIQVKPESQPQVKEDNGSALDGQKRLEAQGEVQTSRRSRRRRGKDRQQAGERSEGYETAVAELQEVAGILDLREDGYGFLRSNGYLSSSRDVYVPASLARKLALRRGDYIVGAARPASSSEKYPALSRVDTVSGLDAEEARKRPKFEDLTPLFPNERFTLESPNEDPGVLTARIIDLIAPIGKGQRGLIVSPPKAGKTTVMKQIAHAIERNNPEVVLIVLLVDERPEEVTDMRRSVKGEVIASTFDRPAEEHTQVSELTIERAKRLVELGKDVVIILDGITRLARAYNLAQPASGRIMSGGVDSGALYPPKKFFGAARNVEEGGSLTILATALVETGSKMDEVIFEEFKGTGNMELKLDRRLAERRLYPAIDVNGSSTRHEELLFSRDELNQVWKLRRVLNAITQEGSSAAGLELLIDKIRSTRSNAEFLAEIARSPGLG